MQLGPLLLSVFVIISAESLDLYVRSSMLAFRAVVYSDLAGSLQKIKMAALSGARVEPWSDRLPGVCLKISDIESKGIRKEELNGYRLDSRT